MSIDYWVLHGFELRHICLYIDFYDGGIYSHFFSVLVDFSQTEPRQRKFIVNAFWRFMNAFYPIQPCFSRAIIEFRSKRISRDPHYGLVVFRKNQAFPIHDWDCLLFSYTRKRYCETLPYLHPLENTFLQRRHSLAVKNRKTPPPKTRYPSYYPARHCERVEPWVRVFSLKVLGSGAGCDRLLRKELACLEHAVWLYSNCLYPLGP